MADDTHDDDDFLAESKARMKSQGYFSTGKQEVKNTLLIQPKELASKVALLWDEKGEVEKVAAMAFLKSRWFHALYLGFLAVATMILIGRNVVENASLQVWLLAAIIWVAPLWLGYCAVRYLRAGKD